MYVHTYTYIQLRACVGAPERQDRTRNVLMYRGLARDPESAEANRCDKTTKQIRVGTTRQIQLLQLNNYVLSIDTNLGWYNKTTNN